MAKLLGGTTVYGSLSVQSSLSASSETIASTNSATNAFNANLLTLVGAASGSVFKSMQNLVVGASASTDISIYNDQNTYIDLGIASSQYNGSVFGPAFTVVGPGDGYLYTTNNNLALGTASYGNVNFFTGGTLSGTNARMTITSAGLVGIGTSTPNVSLAVTNSISANNTVIAAGTWSNNIYTGVSGDGVIIDYLQGSPGLGRISVGNGTGADSLAFYSNGPGLSVPSTTMFLSSNGMVGINTSTPNTTFTVQGAMSANGSLAATTLSANTLYGNNTQSVLTDGTNLLGNGTNTLSINYLSGVYVNSSLSATKTLSAAEVYITTVPSRLFLYAPNGVRYYLNVTNAGVLTATAG